MRSITARFRFAGVRYTAGSKRSRKLISGANLGAIFKTDSNRPGARVLSTVSGLGSRPAETSDCGTDIPPGAGDPPAGRHRLEPGRNSFQLYRRERRSAGGRRWFGNVASAHRPRSDEGPQSTLTSEHDLNNRARYKEASYIWVPDSKHLLFDANGQLWFFDLGTKTGVQVASTGAGSGDDPKFSPDGAYLSYVRGHNIYVNKLKDTNAAARLTDSQTDATLDGESTGSTKKNSTSAATTSGPRTHGGSRTCR